MPVIPFPTKELNKKRVALVIILSAMFLLLVTLILIYSFNVAFRTWIDIYLFRKEMKAENPKIPIDRVIYKIKEEINPYGKPFEGNVYAFGVFLMKWLEKFRGI